MQGYAIQHNTTQHIFLFLPPPHFYYFSNNTSSGSNAPSHFFQLPSPWRPRPSTHGFRLDKQKHTQPQYPILGRSHLKETIFWRNYFHHCELVRRAHLANTASLPQEQDDADSMRSSLGSLVPAESAPLSGPPGQDDGSYVCVRKGIASPPSSLNTLTETMSVGDIVLVGADGNDMNTLDMK